MQPGAVGVDDEQRSFVGELAEHKSTIHFRVRFKRGWVRGCIHNTVLLRPGNRYVWDGPGQITATSRSLRRYRGVRVHDGGLTKAGDLTHVTPFSVDTNAPGKKC